MNTQNDTKIFQQELAGDFQMKVFGLVGYAMAVTATTTFFAGSIFQAFPILSNGWIGFAVIIGLIFTEGMWARKEPINFILFSFIAFLLGLSIAPLIGYAMSVDPVIVTKAFISTASLSIAAGIYGGTTKRDLSGIGGFLTMALIGLIIVGVLNIFWPSSATSFFVSGAGVVLFSVFIAYDINTLKHYPEDMAISAAIGLYLSIFNLFKSILSLLLQFSDD